MNKETEKQKNSFSVLLFFRSSVRAKRAGFTLIELLVVIAIIGILSSVVLASLRTAREKGANAAAKANLANARAQAELYYDENVNSYKGVCKASNGISGMINAVKDAVGNVDCVDPGTIPAAPIGSWAASANLKKGGTWCVDSTGYSGAGLAAGGSCSTNP